MRTETIGIYRINIWMSKWHSPNTLIDVFKWKGDKGWPMLAGLSLLCEFKSHKIALSELDRISLIRSLAKLLQDKKIFCLPSFHVGPEVIWIWTKNFFNFMWWHLQKEKGPVVCCNINLNLRSLFFHKCYYPVWICVQFQPLSFPIRFSPMHSWSSMKILYRHIHIKSY